MNLNFGDLFQTQSKDTTMRGLVRIPENPEEWPDTWKNIEFKEYGGQFKKIYLPKPSLECDVRTAIHSRRSVREWSSDPISLDDISNVFYYSCGTIQRGANPIASRRAQASAGKRYPLEAYIINYIPGDLPSGVYHYNPEEHSLDELWNLESFGDIVLKNLFSYKWAHDAACSIFITGVIDRSQRKYGERAYRYAYLEAGGVAHMMHMIGSLPNLGSVIVAGFNDNQVERVLDIDGTRETLLTSVCLGKIKIQ